jgi:hypothetical protein
MKKLEELGLQLLKKQHFDTLAVGVLDFNSSSFESFEIHHQNELNPSNEYFFDLASLTKPLTLATTYHKHSDMFSEDMLRLLHHRAGLPIGGRITVNNWRDYISKFTIANTDQETSYSDYSALRSMLEIEKKSGKTLYDLCNYYWDKDLISWLDLPEDTMTPMYGSRHGFPIHGVHDDNAYYLNEKVSHAGLFATIKGLCRSILNLEQKVGLLSQMEKGFQKYPEQRFIYGWDTVTNPETSLAGKGCSTKTFGHLGFTGTSIWIDLEKKRASIILTNATQNYWYDRPGLRELRRELGQAVWGMS